ncbi:unnamed protein product [Chondrus crispus]|uniref:Probable ATP-dependent transporter ycf16 n=1 Tax=Chondrus crispus TaxID=2769 RepID=R7QKH4_CHOCR|nr:unnamed protein product [Chondrus crispus]CDF38574.1 unnamed protein product [Chondrus crispus]|eukprot:XP_005718479.1 unnamed protein product [Chondrus crispus]
MDRGSNSIESVVNTVVFTLFPTIIEALVVTAIFFKLGTPWIAITTLATVIAPITSCPVRSSSLIYSYLPNHSLSSPDSRSAVDILINYETVKMFGMEQEEASTYAALQKAYQDIYIWFRLTRNAISLGQDAIKSIGLGSAMVLAAIGAAHGNLTPGDFVLINAYAAQLFGPLFSLGSTYRTLTQAATDLEKCVNLLTEPITVQDDANAKPFEVEEEALVEKRVGDVRFENVSFKYHGTERGSSGGLRNISFHVAPGRMVAFVGASGAGKSTIIRLLLRFYDVDSGSVFIDGENVRNYSQESLRKQIGVVAQDTILFNRSLRFNISYGKPDACDAEIYDAARSAALGDFVDSLPLKLDTIVGERGVRLSGGERQRVGCARCLIKAPAIVLLDEASSSLDTQTEREMQANLREVCKNRTTIVIAHRLSTIMMADEIIVLGTDGAEEGLGTVVERGSHAELIRQKGSYAEMWDLQTSFDNGELSEASEVKDSKK